MKPLPSRDKQVGVSVRKNASRVSRTLIYNLDHKSVSPAGEESISVKSTCQPWEPEEQTTAVGYFFFARI